MDDEERIALLLDYENLAIGSREGGIRFLLKPITDALAGRGRVIVRRAYADWARFQEDGRVLAQANVELVSIPQRMGAVRKNAADIKLAVDAVELCFSRGYVTTFVLGTGDSDFTPLMQKLRELNRRVIGVGLKTSTSALLPAACDEFLFYEGLEGVEAIAAALEAPPPPAEAPVPAVPAPAEETTLIPIVTGALSALKQGTGGAVYASTLKRAILRREPTFNETDFGFRGFGELLQHLAEQQVIQLAEGLARGDPDVDFPSAGGNEDEAYTLLQNAVRSLEARGQRAVLSRLKNAIRRERADFDEKQFGFGSFLQFCRSARARGRVDIEWNADLSDYVLRSPNVREPSP
jgi:uncharacterized LabA/DUF88 family protein